MHLLLKSALGTLALGTALLVVEPAKAVTLDRVYTDQGGPACQLSVPTTSSQVRPRATGFRNEGTSSEFVICRFPFNGSYFYQTWVEAISIDGNVHDVQCTGVNSAESSFKYVTKSASVNAIGAAIVWTAWDFPPFSGPIDHVGGGAFSATCVLPPGTAVQTVTGLYKEDVGS